MKEAVPKKIRIMADYGIAYAWDEYGTNIGLAYSFEDYFNIRKIIALECKLRDWAFWFDSSDLEEKFPWVEFSIVGLGLAEELARLIKGNGIKIVYCHPFEENEDVSRKDIIIDKGF